MINMFLKELTKFCLIRVLRILGSCKVLLKLIFIYGERFLKFLKKFICYFRMIKFKVRHFIEKPIFFYNGLGDYFNYFFLNLDYCRIYFIVFFLKFIKRLFYLLFREIFLNFHHNIGFVCREDI
jgi:hypothetical protein